MKKKVAWFAAYIVVALGTSSIGTSIPLQCGSTVWVCIFNGRVAHGWRWGICRWCGSKVWGCCLRGRSWLRSTWFMGTKRSHLLKVFFPTYMGFECADVKKEFAWFATSMIVALRTSTICTSIPLQCSSAVWVCIFNGRVAHG